MGKYLAKIGLEMHCEVSETNTKVFSAAENSYKDTPNCNVSAVDMAFPGTLPVVNKEAVRLALMASMILKCSQPEYFFFERKNYYYPDLPKGFQTTQETKPIPSGIYGEVEFECNGELKKVRVNNLHLEEDAASLDHYYSTSNIDYNRAGVPLLELVTEPDIHSADEAVAFLEHMRSVYQYAGISEADSKKGQIRCDVNISLMDASLDESDPNNWGTRAEIKNVNSFGGVRDAINYEIVRQSEILDNGGAVEQETRRWDEESGTTIYMRSKVDAIDYKYFVEPNIPKFKISQEWLDEIRASIPELAMDRKKKYIEQYGLSEYDAGVIVKEKCVSDYFEECLKLNMNAKTAANWLTVQIIAYINKYEIELKDFYLTPVLLNQIITELDKGTISSKQAKEIFFKSLEENKEPKTFITKDNAQISDEGVLNDIISNILANNENQVNEYKSGKTNLFDYFVGQVMKETRGKANPNIVKEILKGKLDN
ncbi:MAG: Asp-tRNA(Asn)/Glu-tRNA(Gln) amidotransferase subunit GatB [Bacilli bacterium]|nr:Asp-tRNA(Asn)/Glu-tRNA(Gln) amidotransferase subunit GatB [Bacilli bacterium]MBQ8902286.1 Asp-tRNA(Asn)/Glu-tRNA(Gln) amidotransferase subunit GatB [Bacilli bacterium]